MSGHVLGNRILIRVGTLEMFSIRLIFVRRICNIYWHLSRLSNKERILLRIGNSRFQHVKETGFYSLNYHKNLSLSLKILNSYLFLIHSCSLFISRSILIHSSITYFMRDLCSMLLNNLRRISEKMGEVDLPIFLGTFLKMRAAELPVSPKNIP